MTEAMHGTLSKRLAGLTARLDVLFTDPDVLMREASWLRRTWVALSGASRGPLFASTAMRAFADGPATLERWEAHRDAIATELEQNVERLERAARIGSEVPLAITSWLYAVLRWIESMERARQAPSIHAWLALTRGIASRPRLGPVAGPVAGEDPADMLALAGVDALLDEAAQETERVARRRRLLEAARRVLLDAEATARVTAGFTTRRAMIAEELLQLVRIEAAGVRADVHVSHQLRARMERRRVADVAVACAATSYLRAGTTVVTPPAFAAFASRLGTTGQHDASLPDAVSDAVERGYRRAREVTEDALESAGPTEALELRRRRTYLHVEGHRSLLRMALGVDGVFDVGGGLERERVEELSPTVDVVPYPTQELELREATAPGDVQHAILEDPRLIVHHLATRRLLMRRYVQRGQAKRQRNGVRAAVRFYLLDGSTSMSGPRARMRDAVLVAELASLVSRLERPGGRIRSLLYYRYFNSAAEVTRRVASIPEALETIEEILGAARAGGTDIEGALVDSIELIAKNRERDVELSRAQIVLVTDGLAKLDPILIHDVQKRLDIPVRVSIIVLGEESPPLRALAASQREAGLKVLYQHVSDERLLAWEEEGGGAWPSFDATNVEPEGLDAMIDELATNGVESRATERTRHGDADDYVDALREVGLDEAHLDEGTRAKLDASRRDLRALRRRFDRSFPEIHAPIARLSDPDDVGSALVLDALGVVAEVLALSASDELTAMADAIAIFERLLATRGLTPRRYLEIAESHPDRVGPAIRAVRSLCRVDGLERKPSGAGTS